MTRLLALAFLLVAVALGLTPAGRADAVKDVKTNPDDNFLIKAVASGQAEVKFSQLAEKHATSADVKEFAGKMVKDHTDANKQLLVHAKGTKVAIVTGLDADRRTAYTNLERLKGDDFDREYMRMMVNDHEKAVALFQDYSKSGTKEELKQFAARTLPTLKHHLDDARKISEKLKK